MIADAGGMIDDNTPDNAAGRNAASPSFQVRATLA
jgi:hypothetical protein